jgi:Nuclear pore protein 84 / 107
MWRGCSLTWSRQNWQRLALQRSARRNTLTIASSLSHGRCSSAWRSARHSKPHRRVGTRAERGSGIIACASNFRFSSILDTHSDEVQGIVSNAHEQILKLLSTDWLVPDTEIPAGESPIREASSGCLVFTARRFAADRRARELARIRQLFIPELILRLHTILVSSRTHIPECALALLIPPCHSLIADAAC